MSKLSLFIITLVLMTSKSYAADDNKMVFPPKDWTSTSVNDAVTISNGSGMRMMAVITVNGSGKDAPGATLTNCGDITKIVAGGTAICGINDPRNPLTITTDNVNKPVSGTYQLRPVQ